MESPDKPDNRLLQDGSKTCSRYTGQAGKTVVVTWELDREYLVNAVLLLGQASEENQLSEFYIYIGQSPNFKNNALCPGGPFAYPTTREYGTYDDGSNWVNGVEAMCGLKGSYVSFVRYSNAVPELEEVVICAFGVIASTDCSNVDEFSNDDETIPTIVYEAGANKIQTKPF